MVQFFKKLVLMFKSKQRQNIYPAYIYNKNELLESYDRIASRLFLYKQEESLKDVRELLQIAKNISMLECCDSIDEKDMIKRQAKLDVFTKVVDSFEYYINRKTIEKSEGKHAVVGTIKTFRRPSNSAGASI